MPPPIRPDDNPNANKISPRPAIGGPPVAARPAQPARVGIGEPEVDHQAIKDAMPITPGDETVWEQYSPNGEPLLSGFASFLLHGLLLLVILVGFGWLFSGEKEVQLDDLEEVEIGNGEIGGGGGSVEGVGGAPGNLTRPEDQVKSIEEDKPNPTLPEDKDTTVKASKDDIPDPTQMVIEKMKKPEAKKLGPVLKDALEGIAGKGKGGSGQGGGEGTGVGTGRGSGQGPGTGRTNRRGARNLRWELTFGQSEARQYLQQTDAVGMYLVVPDRNGNPMKVADIRQRPAKLELVDVKALKRNWFTDDRQDSCNSVAESLGLEFVPAALLFFYPIEFEEALLKKELAHKGRKEEDIEYTKFAISFSGGKPNIRVMEQRPFAGRK